MANEFIARNGLISQNNSTITGSLLVSSSNATQLLVGSSSLFVSSSGNVGIGTTNPLRNFEVGGQSIRWGTSGGNYADIIVPNNSRLGIRIDNNGNRFYGIASFRSDGGSELMFLSNTGNLGIGTTAPSTTLDIRTSGQGYVTIGGVDGRTLTAYNNSGTASILNTGATSFDGFIYGSNFFDRGTNTQSVRLSTTTTSLWTSGSQRLTVDNAGNVGIGTSTPTYRLQINSAGSANTSVPLTLTSVDVNNRVGILFGSSSLASGRQHRLFHRTTTSLAEWIMDTTAGASANWTLTPTDNSAYAVTITTPFATGSDARMYAGSNHRSLTLSAGGSNDALVIRSGSGNVGIGTASPAKLLDVNGDVLINGQTVGRGGGNISSNTTVGPASLFSNTTGTNNVSIGTSTMYTNTTGANNVAIGSSALGLINTSANNVAIGQASLQNSTGGSNTAIGQSTLNSITSGNSNTALGRLAGRFIADKVTLLTSIDNSVLIGYQASPLGQAQTNQIVIGYDATGLGSNTTVLGNSSTTTTAIYGNVGIGTTAPTAKLHISGTYDAGSANANSLIINTTLLTPGVNGLTQAGALISPTFNTSNSNVSNAYGVKISPNHTGNFTTTNAYGLYVDSTTLTSGSITNNYAASFNGGNVGIRTTAPTTPLHVSGTIQVQTATGNTFYGQDSGGSYARTFGVELYDFRDAAGSTKVRINTSTGNVGIGTTAPTAKLHITAPGALATDIALRVRNSADTVDVILLRGDGTIQANGIKNASGNFYIDAGPSGDIFIRPGTTGYNRYSYFRSNGNVELAPFGGNVGIGTSTPNAKLDVSGSAIISGSLTVTGGITGSLLGSSSYALTASYALNGGGGGGGSSTIIDDSIPTVVDGGTWYQPASGSFSVGITGSWVTVGRDGANGAPGTVTTGSVSYITIASDLVSRITTSSGAWDFSQAGIIDATISSNTSASFSNLQLNKTLKVEIMVSGSAALSFPSYCKPTVGSVNPSGINGTYYAYFDCWNATSGSEIVLQSIVQLA